MKAQQNMEQQLTELSERDARHSAGLSFGDSSLRYRALHLFISDSQSQPNLRRCHVKTYPKAKATPSAANFEKRRFSGRKRGNNMTVTPGDYLFCDRVNSYNSPPAISSAVTSMSAAARRAAAIRRDYLFLASAGQKS
ncbi:hypothetical protein EVAR_55006_1 [Eumeta japonica]|uniref:Uncharacterized protein n=1 Tax=Eumeta variegata TaxID=151549 RepID=A0A4C1YDX2_EUMVA|nr:hypothetical protein EVAR_55006_1 [Eumeta japonica]